MKPEAIDECPSHFGHIALELPVMHILHQFDQNRAKVHLQHCSKILYDKPTPIPSIQRSQSRTITTTR